MCVHCVALGGSAGGAFSINGLEFDLDELEQFELRLKAKRAAAAAVAASSDDAQSLPVENSAEQGLDDLDDYLSRLAIDAERQPDNSVDNSLSTVVASHQIEQPQPPTSTDSQPAPVLLYFALGLLFFVSTVMANNPTTISALSMCKQTHRSRSRSY